MSSYRINYRRIHAQRLTSEILSIIHEHINQGEDYDSMRKISLDLEKLFFQNGVEFLTDYIREELKLPPRGPDGWTDEEDRRQMKIDQIHFIQTAIGRWKMVISSNTQTEETRNLSTEELLHELDILIRDGNWELVRGL